jgi:hypothetical protein
LLALFKQALLFAALATRTGTGVTISEVKMGDGHEDYERRIESFLERVGFARLAGVAGSDGIRVDWSILHAELSRRLSKMRPAFSNVYLLASGLVEADWGWKRADEHVAMSIVVSGSGFTAVHRHLFSRSTETTMVRIPYGPGPKDLGDLALRNQAAGTDLIMWVYRNVFVHVEGDVAKMDLEPIARVIQRFMEEHRVPRVAEHLPRVDRIQTSAKQVHVGDVWQVSLELGRNTPVDSVTIELDEDHDRRGEYLLEPTRSSGLRSSYQARAPGTARLDIRVADRKTLLSPPLSASVEILPAR